MNNKKDIGKRIEDAMNSIDGIDRAAPSPFFYTRLEARLMRQEKSVWEKLGRTVGKPAFAIMSLGLVIMINAFVILKGITSGNTLAEGSDIAMVDEYNNSTSTHFYDIDNVQP